MITRTRYRKQRHKKRHKRDVAATVAATVAVLPAINLLFKIMRLIIRRIKYSWLLWTRQKSENKHVTWALKGSDWKRSFLSFRINILFYSIFSLPARFKYVSIFKRKKITHVYPYLYFLLGYHFSSPSRLDSVAEGERKSVKKKWLIVFQACLAKYRDNFRGKTWWARQFSPCILCVDLQSQWK